MKVVVTGAAGFIGSHAAQHFRASGHDVLGIDFFADYYSPALKRLNTHELEYDGIPFFERDLSADVLGDVVADAEIVLHAAAQPGISEGTGFDDYVRHNLVATHRLLEAVKPLTSLKCFIYVSTSSVYGRYATSPETAAPAPTSPYGVTKLAGEQLALSYQREYALPVCALRLFSVYGPRERPEKLYFKLIRSMFEDRAYPLYEGSLVRSRSYTYVDDVLSAFLAAAADPERCAGEIFNIGSDIETTTGDGIRIVEEIIGKKARLSHLPRRAGDQQRTHADIGKARRVLGYAPCIAPEQGLCRQVEWYRDHIHGKVAL